MTKECLLFILLALFFLCLLNADLVAKNGLGCCIAVAGFAVATMLSVLFFERKK